MQVRLYWRRPWPPPWVRVVIVIIIVASAERWAPGAAVPLIGGTLLGGWAAAQACRAPGFLPAVTR
jgi:hypothetical protein